jgi:predicted ATPase
VDALLDADRLVTLTGAGVGKTRLAQAVAAEHGGPQDVRWVELAGMAEGHSVAAAILAMVGVGRVPGVDSAPPVARALSDASLLILDNCEHLVGDCAAPVRAVVATNSSVSVLTTSREPLAVPGEATWRVPSLEAPGPSQPADAGT